MTDLPIPAGPTNAEIVEEAYRHLGMVDAMFGRTEEETATGVAMLRTMMVEWPFSQLGYDDLTAAPAERSGITRQHMTAVSTALAERLSGPTGKAMTQAAVRLRASSYSALCAAVANTPAAQFSASTPAGAGNRRFGAFLRSPI